MPDRLREVYAKPRCNEVLLDSEKLLHRLPQIFDQILRMLQAD
jgi:hypothetical protein